MLTYNLAAAPPRPRCLVAIAVAAQLLFLPRLHFAVTVSLQSNVGHAVGTPDPWQQCASTSVDTF
jgi:hypothetical protein